MKESVFPCTLELRIDWSELDYFGHVNNVSFFKYIQAARVNCWEQLGINALYASTEQGPILVSCRCDFQKALHFPGTVHIATALEFVGNTSFGFHHRLRNDQQELIAEAHDVMVMFDYPNQVKMGIPESIKARMEQ